MPPLLYMGLFSTKQTSVATSSVLMLDDTPNLVADAVLIAIMNDRPIVDDIVACYIDGIAVKADSYYNYGRDTYSYGLPSGTMTYNSQEDSDVELVIEADIGKDINLLLSVVDTCITDYFAYTYLAASRGWDGSTDIVSTPSFTATGVVTYVGSAVTSDGVLELTYTDAGDATTHTETITTEVLYPNERYYHVTYTVGDSTVTKYWNYRISLGTWSALVTNATSTGNSYFPVIPMRRNNVDMTDSTLESTTLYKTSKAALDKLGIDFTDIGDAINENDDVDDVDHAYVMIGAHIYSEVDNTIKYFHAFFKELYGISKYTAADAEFFAARDNNKSVPPVNRLRITEDNYDVELTYRYITKETVTGSVGDVGDVVRSVDIRDDAHISYTVTSSSGSATSRYVYYDDSRVTFSKQLTDTTYQKITVVGPTMINHIYKDYTVDATLSDSTDIDESSFIIPVNILVARSMGLMEYNYLMYDTIRLVFNSYKVTHLKWYQSAGFTFLIQIVAIAATIYSLGTAYATVGAAASISAAAAIKVAAIILIKTVVYSYVGTLIVDAIGLKEALIATVLIAVYQATQGDITGISLGSVAGAPFAIDLLSITQALSLGIKQVTADAMQAITDEYADFTEEADLLNEALEDKIDELDTGIDIDPLAITQHQSFVSDTWETPTEFYDRTVHAGNIGIYCLDSTSVYVEQLVKLPTTINL